jgi:hypothetical protein
VANRGDVQRGALYKLAPGNATLAKPRGRLPPADGVAATRTGTRNVDTNSNTNTNGVGAGLARDRIDAVTQIDRVACIAGKPGSYGR